MPATTIPYYRLSDAAEFLGVTPNGLRHIIAQGKIAPVDLEGGGRVLPARDLKRLAKQRAKSGT
jgi:predicted site-specific integrase-resolvase